MRKVLLSADSTCDIGKELQQRYNVHYFHYHVLLEDQSYVDMVDITPDEIYAAWRERRVLPKTAAITPYEYMGYFENWVNDGYDVVHINLGSTLSSAHQNCCAAASALGNVYPIDSENLSTGMGLLVLKAGQMIEQGYGAEQIQQEINDMKHRAHASFLLDTLEFMAAGGRCSAITAFGANVLQLKPCIEVNNTDGGAMGVDKKYRGSMEKSLKRYVADKLADRDDLDNERIFITHSGSPESDIELVREQIGEYADFKNIHVTRASSTISSHCGPRTLGILFMTK